MNSSRSRSATPWSVGTVIVFNPGQVNFGVVPRGQSPTQSVDVEYAGALDWRVSEIIGSAAPLTVDLKEFERRPGYVGYRVSVTAAQFTARPSIQVSGGESGSAELTFFIASISRLAAS